jgi:hypothetical protein
LTIKPSIGKVTTLKQNESVQVLKSDEKNDLIVNGYTVASVWNHSAGDHVEVFGGTNAGSGPVTITINMADK